MKLHSITAALALLLLAASCDNIPEDERYLDNPREPAQKKVLIFEFTGQRCTNCPEGAEAVTNIQARYPGDVIAVNLHPENTSYTNPMGNARLTSPAATFLYDYYKPSAFPAACIDGQKPVMNIQQWSTDVSEAIKIEAPATIDLDVAYDETLREVTVNYNVNFNLYTAEELVIQVMLLEDGIVAMQTVNGRPVRDYVHNHVLRTSLYPDWGQSMGNLFEVYSNYSGSVKCTLDEDWVAENCHIVAFINNGGDHLVRQAAEADVIAHEGNDEADGDDSGETADDNTDNTGK